MLGKEIDKLIYFYVIKPFGTKIYYARKMVSDDGCFQIDSIYKSEAKGIIDGMNKSILK